MPDSPATTPAPLLSVRDLHVTFRTRRGLVPAVDGVSFDLAAGEILGVVGESGSGKSVSMLSIMALINQENVSVTGSIKFRGRELIGLPGRDMRALRGRDIAMIFQDPMTALTPVYSIGWQMVEQIRAHQDVSRKGARQRAIELLGEVGMPAPASQFERFPHELSGGMRQRAVIAMALSCNPSILIADEPTTALDVTVQAQILDLLQRLRERFQSSVLLITHDMGVVAELADRVMVMYAGRVIERGATRALFDAPWHPYTWGLLGSIPPLEGKRPKRLLSIRGAPPSLTSLPAGCAFEPRCDCAFAACSTRPEIGPIDQHSAACWLDQASRDKLRPDFLSHEKSAA
jgi:peptide/nickel transport system ATP-binding protein